MRTRLIAACGMLFALGCGGSPQPAPKPAAAAPAPPVKMLPLVAEQQQPVPVVEAPPVVHPEAKVGVGVKGKDYGSDPISTPIKALFRTKERIAFEIQIPDALKQFQALEGRNPKSHEEFMDVIIKENGVRLPQLPPGQHFVYVPEQGEYGTLTIQEKP